MIIPITTPVSSDQQTPFQEGLGRRWDSSNDGPAGFWASRADWANWYALAACSSLCPACWIGPLWASRWSMADRREVSCALEGGLFWEASMVFTLSRADTKSKCAFSAARADSHKSACSWRFTCSSSCAARAWRRAYSARSSSRTPPIERSSSKAAFPSAGPGVRITAHRSKISRGTPSSASPQLAAVRCAASCIPPVYTAENAPMGASSLAVQRLTVTAPQGVAASSWPWEAALRGGAPGSGP